VTAEDKKDPALATAGRGDVQARLMLVLLCLIWGITWPVMKIALEEIPPFSMRTLAAGIGALTLFAICRVKRRSLRIPNAKSWAHVVIASLLNVVGFSVFTAFAQLAAETSRVAIVTYTMPIWAVLLAWAILGERPTRIQGAAIASCVVGLAILIYPLAASGIPLGVVLALCTGLSWATGTVYLQWARIDADPMGVASWQLTIAFFVIAACLLMFEGQLHLGHAHTSALLATAFTGIGGNGIAYGLWFSIVRRLPTTIASLGVLGSPVIGVVSSILLLGERLTVTDTIGFALIFVASACVLLTRQPPAEVAT
jgi:drug/metabolite transporter (DMT)-like permease